MGRHKLFVALVAASVGFLGAPVAAEAEPSGEVVGASARASTSLPEPPPVEPPEPSVQHPVRPSQVDRSRLEDLPMVELTDLRDARSRTFEHPGGARTIDAYAEPIHYEDQQGSWLPIDNTLRDEPARPGWVSSSGNGFTVALGPLEDGIEVSAGGSTLRMSPVLDLAEDEVGGTPDAGPAERRSDDAGGDHSRQIPVVREVDSPRPAPTPKRFDDLTDQVATAEPSSAIYSEVWPGVDLEYELSATGLKEDIVL